MDLWQEISIRHILRANIYCLCITRVMGTIHYLLLSNKFEHIRIICWIVLLSLIFINRNVTPGIFCSSDAIEGFKTTVDGIIELFLRVDEIKGWLIDFTSFSHDWGSPIIFTLLNSKELGIIFVKILFIRHSFRKLGHVLVLQIMDILFELIMWRSVDLPSSLQLGHLIKFHEIGVATSSAWHHGGLIWKIDWKDVALEVTDNATLLLITLKMSMAFATPVIYVRLSCVGIHIKMWKTVLFEVSGA